MSAVRAVALASALAALPDAALAEPDPDLARLQALSVKLVQRMGSALGAKTPGGRAVAPRLSWTPALEDAGSCTLTAYRKRIGAKRVSDILDEVDKILSRKVLRLADAQAAGERLRPLPQDQMTRIDQQCGFTLAGLQSLMADPNFAKFAAQVAKTFQPPKK